MGCATSPEGRRQLMVVPEGQMDQMGSQAFAELKTKTPIDTDAADNRYVDCVANAIAAKSGLTDAKWEIVVFKDPTANAFALPGGKIGVHTGILPVAKTPDQLAAVLGHEVGHVIAKHGAERVSEQMIAQGGLAALDAILGRGETGRSKILMASLGLGYQFGVALPHSRTQESEADVIGLRLMAKAGFNPEQAVELWRNMMAAGGAHPPEFMSDHPANETRIANLQAHMPEALEVYRASTDRPHCVR